MVPLLAVLVSKPLILNCVCDTCGDSPAIVFSFWWKHGPRPVSMDWWERKFTCIEWYNFHTVITEAINKYEYGKYGSNPSYYSNMTDTDADGTITRMSVLLDYISVGRGGEISNFWGQPTISGVTPSPSSWLKGCGRSSSCKGWAWILVLAKRVDVTPLEDHSQEKNTQKQCFRTRKTSNANGHKSDVRISSEIKCTIESLKGIWEYIVTGCPTCMIRLT